MLLLIFGVSHQDNTFGDGAVDTDNDDNEDVFCPLTNRSAVASSISDTGIHKRQF